MSFQQFLFILSLFYITSCGNQTPEAVKEEQHSEETNSNMVSLTGLQMKTAGIELGIIEMKNLESSIKANGVLSVPKHNKGFITAISSGVVKTLLIQPGDYVRKGQVVATIINPDLAQMQQQLQTVLAQQSLTELELARQKELVKGNAAPLKNVQRAETELATLKATRYSLQKQLSALGVSSASVSRGNIITTLSISSPISGTISDVTAQIGSNVDPSTPIAEVVNNSHLHLDLYVFEKDLPKLSVNQVIHFTLTNNPGKEYDAKIFSIGTSFANDTKTIVVHAEVKGDKRGLIEGMNVTAIVSLGAKVAPAVPTDAIVSAEGHDYIFVLSEDKHKEHNDSEEKGASEEGEGELLFERVEVVKGASDVGFTEITPLKDLPPNAQIVTKGAFFVSAKMTNTEEHGH